ncbi:hypothetical protein DSL72_005423 [Monilinia vaccinii-corymbosi]|uniref:Transcription factor CBF/NF-Y/archaeal histone domain-containing protein n=1 Tax=Monilinia vaccinii-corymbosi TaxID=61207 RepID=A0A8A3PFI9_9HELO|nr:hypothetical protein DSL72_005423 [Monilinia vaccinii-corymbosi]
MAAGQKLYPRASLKKIVKAHSKRNLTKNVDVLIFLDYMLFLETLMKEASINAKQAGERGISAKSIKKVTEVCLTFLLPPITRNNHFVLGIAIEIQGMRLGLWGVVVPFAMCDAIPKSGIRKRMETRSFKSGE